MAWTLGISTCRVPNAGMSLHCIISMTREMDATTIGLILQMKILSLRMVNWSATRKRRKVTRLSKALDILLAEGGTTLVAWLKVHSY